MSKPSSFICEVQLWYGGVCPDLVTCVALDNCGKHLMTGSQDCTCIIWEVTTDKVTPPVFTHNFTAVVYVIWL